MKPDIITVNGKEYCMIPLEQYNEIKDNILGFKPKRKVAFVVGHTETKQGDWSYLYKSSEWNYWFDFLMSNFSDMGLFLHNFKLNSYTERQKEMAERTKDYDLVIEFHFNAFDPDGDHKDNACGAEALVEKVDNDLEYMSELASVFIQSMHNKMGIKERSVKWLNSSDNGYGFLNYTKGDAIILEPFFGDCKDDIDKFSQAKYKEVIDEMIDYYYENIYKK